MKRFLACCIAVLSGGLVCFSQTTAGKLKFGTGQKIEITQELKTRVTQEVMGKAIDFNVEGTAFHFYKVTNATDENTTLHHQVSQIKFSYDGMGRNDSFDSKNDKDMNGTFGKPIKDILDRPFDIIIDSYGNTLLSKTGKYDSSSMTGQMTIITNMLKDVLDIWKAPKKGEPSFFKILPEKELTTGLVWADSTINETGKFVNNYTITSINDSTIIVDLTGHSTSVTKAELMGTETITTLNNKTTGKIIVDKLTGVMRQKTTTTESSGSTAVRGGTLPATSKTVATISVKML